MWNEIAVWNLKKNQTIVVVVVAENTVFRTDVPESVFTALLYLLCRYENNVFLTPDHVIFISHTNH